MHKFVFSSILILLIAGLNVANGQNSSVLKKDLPPQTQALNLNFPHANDKNKDPELCVEDESSFANLDNKQKPQDGFNPSFAIMQRIKDGSSLTEQEQVILSYINEIGPLNIPQEEVDYIFEHVCSIDEKKTNFVETCKIAEQKNRLVSNMLDLGLMPQKTSKALAKTLFNLKRTLHPKLASIISEDPCARNSYENNGCSCVLSLCINIR